MPKRPRNHPKGVSSTTGNDSDQEDTPPPPPPPPTPTPTPTPPPLAPTSTRTTPFNLDKAGASKEFQYQLRNFKTSKSFYNLNSQKTRLYSLFFIVSSRCQQLRSAAWTSSPPYRRNSFSNYTKNNSNCRFFHAGMEPLRLDNLKMTIWGPPNKPLSKKKYLKIELPTQDFFLLRVIGRKPSKLQASLSPDNKTTLGEHSTRFHPDKRHDSQYVYSIKYLYKYFALLRYRRKKWPEWECPDPFHQRSKSKK